MGSLPLSFTCILITEVMCVCGGGGQFITYFTLLLYIMQLARKASEVKFQSYPSFINVLNFVIVGR